MQNPTDNLDIDSREQPLCPICQNGISGFTNLISQSLSGKYSSAQNFYYTKDIEQIINQQLCHNFIQFQENNYVDDDQQYLKRQYQIGEFPKKIQMLSQYYKFHRNQPTWNDKGIEPLMVKYYSKVKDVDYKKIKNILKKQQNLSITTHKSFSSYQDSQFTKKSRYSTMLNDLNTSENQSALLLDMCDKIGKALKKVKPQQFKGIYYSGQKKFQEFLQKQKRRKQTAKRKQQMRRNNFDFKKIKFNQNLKTKDDELAMRQIKFGSNHSLHNRNILKYKQLSIQKTSANQTISRDQKSRREKSMKNIQLKSSRGSLSKKSYRDHFNSEITPSYKQLGAINLKSIAHNNLKTVNQIYQATSSRLQYNEKKLTRPSSGNKLKYRSNSTHNLQTFKNGNIPNPNKILNTKQQLKINKQLIRTNSRKKIPVSTARGSSINLQDQIDSIQKKNQLKNQRQMSHRILRTNSQRKLVQEPKQNIKFDKKEKKKKKQVPNCERGFTNKNETKQKNKVIETMLQKKLQLFKKKQMIV